MPPELKSDEYKISALNTKNELIDVIVRKCPDCSEMVPKVEPCPECNTPYKHVNTFEDYKTGFIHFIYECSGCPPAERRAQKIIKIDDGSQTKAAKEEFLKDVMGY